MTSLTPTDTPAEASGSSASTSDPAWDSVAFSDDEIYSFLHELAVPPDDSPLLLVELGNGSSEESLGFNLDENLRAMVNELAAQTSPVVREDSTASAASREWNGLPCGIVGNVVQRLIVSGIEAAALPELAEVQAEFPDCPAGRLGGRDLLRIPAVGG